MIGPQRAMPSSPARIAAQARSYNRKRQDDAAEQTYRDRAVVDAAERYAAFILEHGIEEPQYWIALVTALRVAGRLGWVANLIAEELGRASLADAIDKLLDEARVTLTNPQSTSDFGQGHVSGINYCLDTIRPKLRALVTGEKKP